jgi:hypothetical protein
MPDDAGTAATEIGGRFDPRAIDAGEGQNQDQHGNRQRRRQQADLQRRL